MKKKDSPTNNKKRGKFIYIIAFIVPVVLLVLVYALKHVFPFGDNSVLVLDLNAQYIYYYEAFRDAFLGDKSLLYSFSRTLGGEMVGTYAYYLASPYLLILLLFPKVMITEAVLCMILAKVGSASLTFMFFLKKSKNADHLKALLFSIMYALMSYMVVQTMNPMWLDGLILLPIIILGVKKLVDEHNSTLFIISLAVLFITHFYIGYMTGIFVFVYFIYYLITKSDFKFNLVLVKNFIRFMLSTLTSVLLSLWLLIPTYFSLTMGKLSFTTPDFTPLQKLDVMDLFTKLLPMTYDSVNYQGYPFIFCGILVLLLGAYYYINKDISRREKIASAGFIAVMIISFMVSTLDIVLHGFQSPNWLNFRYSFIFSFFLLELSYTSLLKIKQISFQTMVKVLLVLVLLITLIGKQNYYYIIAEKTIWLSLIALLCYTCLLYLFNHYSKQKLIMIILIVLVSLEMFLNAFSMISGAHEEVFYSTRSSYRDYFDKLYPAVDYIKENDSEFYRSETVTKRTVNDPIALGIYGISHSNSALNENVIKMLHNIGFASKEHWTKYKGNTLLSDSIIGMKYIITEKLAQDKYPMIYSENEVSVYENPYALPIMYIANEEVVNVTLDSTDPFINQNTLLSACVGNTYTDYFKLLEIQEIVFENMEGVEQEGFVSYSAINPAINAHIEYIIKTAEHNEMYMYLYSEYPRKVNIWKNKEYVDTFFDYESTCILPLGTSEDKETLSLITTPIEGEYYLNNNMFYYLDQTLFENAITVLKSKEINITKKSETSLEINCSVDRDELLFTTIPYEKGWRIRVNGKKVEGIMVIDSLLAIPLEVGANNITLQFIPYGSILGIMISGIALVFFVYYLVKKKKLKKKVDNEENIS